MRRAGPGPGTYWYIANGKGEFHEESEDSYHLTHLSGRGETEAQRGDLTCPRPHNQSSTEL